MVEGVASFYLLALKDGKFLRNQETFRPLLRSKDVWEIALSH